MTHRRNLIAAALGEAPADLVLQGGTVVSTATGELVQADVIVAGTRIAAVGDARDALVGADTVVVDVTGRFIAPGLIDPHIHLESTNLTVTELARALVPRGVLSICEDPHEIANVLGQPGIELLVDEAAALPLNVYLRVPGRVPAMPAHLETSGHEMSVEATRALLARRDAVCLGGDINPALLLQGDGDQLAKIEACIASGKTVGGQLPGFMGRILNATIAAGVEDTHVAESVDEIIAQLRRGVRVLLTPRIDRLPAEEWPLIAQAVRRLKLDIRYLCLCTDDIHPNILLAEGHLDERVRLAIRSGFTPVEAIQMATINPASLMRLDRDLGVVAPGRFADLVVLDDLSSFSVTTVVHHGVVVARDGALVSEPPAFAYPAWATQSMHLAAPVTASDLAVRVPAFSTARASGPGPEPVDPVVVTVSVVEFGGPKTRRTAVLAVRDDGVVAADVGQDVLSIAVLERHRATGRIGRGFVGGLGIRGGAVACSVNHDSHNIFVVGDSHESMAVAANAIADAGGGYVAVVGTEVRAILELPIAGLMSERPLAEIGAALAAVERVVIDELHCSITYRPMYALNFLCLPNIPEAGFTDMGIIDTTLMELVPTLVP